MTTFAVTGADLHDAAAWAARATPAKPTVPVLAGLLLDAGDHLTISGYDFQTHASVTVPATTTEPGQILLSGKLLNAVAKTLPSGADVWFSDEGGAVQVRAGKSEWTLPGLPIKEYPQLPDEGVPAATVEAGQLRRALARVLPVLSKEPALPVFGAVKVESEGGQLHLVGTDRYRIAVATIPIELTSDDDPLDELVPGVLLDTAARAAGGDTDRVMLSATNGMFGVATETHVTTGRQLAESYVRWRPIIPEPSGHHALIDVPSLVRATDQAMIAADEAPQVLLSFTPDGAQVSALGGSRRARAEAAADLTGDPVTVKVNSRFLRDAISLQGSDKVTMHFGPNPNRPLLVVGDDVGHRHALTPVRLTDQDKAAA